MEIKKFLKEKGSSCRWVTSREPTLSSVVVEQNKLTSKGIEIILIQNNNKILIGRSLCVQPFKELSYRDYGRPARDDHSGMLPPKLAQIMINLARAKKEDTILDPFCGSGTIVTEAILLGYKNILGSDMSQKAVDDTKKNARWIKEKFNKISTTNINNISATDLSKTIKPNSVNAIITEPFLGPQRGKVDYNKTRIELEKLYSKALFEFKKILKPNGKIIMIFPIFKTSNDSYTLSPNLNSLKTVNPIPENLRNNNFLTSTKRNTIIYGRPGQKVWREIIILEKI